MFCIGKPNRKKQGVGSIIGATFLALILISGFMFYAVILNITEHYNTTTGFMNEMDWNRSREKVTIKDIKATHENNLNLTVENQGPMQSHLVWLGISNKTVTPENQEFYALNEYVEPAEVKNIVPNFSVTIGKKYAIQLITELGNVIEKRFYPAGETKCSLTLVAAPPTVYVGNNITIFLTVTHNDTEADIIQDLAVNLQTTPSGLVQLVDNSSLIVKGLKQGESAFFWWIYNTTGIGTVVFNASYSQAPIGTYALSSANIVSVPSREVGNVTITGVNCTVENNPQQWDLLGPTQYASGSTSDLADEDASYLVFRSYQTASSGESLYAHSETTTISGSSYYLQKLATADGAATSLSASMSTVGRQIFGRFVYPLTSVWSIPAGTWTIYYRAWRDASAQVNPTNNPSSTSGGWTNPTNAYADGGGYAYSTTSANSQTYGGYGFSIPSGAQIIQVRVRLDAWSSGNDDTELEVSTDGGSSWLSTSQTINVGGSETTYWIDVTSWTSWTSTAINNDNIRTRVAHVRVGGVNTQYLDYIPIEVTYAIASAGHCDIDIMVRRSDGSVRAAIATNVAASGNLTSAATTLSGAYSWAEYMVVDQTDYLEIDYYVDVTTAATGLNAYLRIDDATLAVSDQTRITNIMLPSEYTAEVEFTGSPNLEIWTQLVWQIDSAWDVGQVTVTIQSFNFTLGDFASSGSGYISYISSNTPNTDELKSQGTSLNPDDFRNSTGHWRVKIEGVKATSSPFAMKIDWIDLEITYLSAGGSIPYNSWQWYTIRAARADGDPIPYAYVSIYANGTTVAFRNTTDKMPISNPAWVRLNANGEIQLEMRSSTSGSAETFNLYAVVGSIVAQKTVTQEAA
jgi:hypothetical protein